MTIDKSNRPPLVLARLWAKRSAKGNAYMTGRLGAARVLVMENRDRRGEDDATHVLMLAETGEREGGR